jgi:hypothetical protein
MSVGHSMSFSPSSVTRHDLEAVPRGIQRGASQRHETQACVAFTQLAHVPHAAGDSSRVP